MGMLKKINPYDTLAKLELPMKYQIESSQTPNLREYRSKSLDEPLVEKRGKFISMIERCL